MTTREEASDGGARSHEPHRARVERESSSARGNQSTHGNDPSDHTERHLYVEAVRAARSGRYLEGTNLLREAREAGACTDAEALDLEGRIHAQRGLYLYAESCWQRAKAIDPDNPAYDRALLELRGGGARRRVFRWAAWALVALPLVLAGIWQFVVVMPEISRRQASLESALAETRLRVVNMGAEIRSDAATRRDQVRSLEQDLDGIAETLSAEAGRLAGLAEANRSENTRARSLIEELGLRQDSTESRLLLAIERMESRLLLAIRRAADSGARSDSAAAAFNGLAESVERSREDVAVVTDHLEVRPANGAAEDCR